MKLTIYVLSFLVILVSVTANNIATAQVSLTIVNNPPEVISIETSEPFEGEALRCDVAIKDEIKDVKTNYRWYKNNVLIADQEGNVLGKEFFVRNDVITCEATPNDLVQDGEPKSVSVTVKPKPFISAITGAVVGVGENVGTLNSFLLLLLMASVIFTAAYFLKRK